MAQAALAGGVLSLTEWVGFGPSGQHVEVAQGAGLGQVVVTAKGNTLLRVDGSLTQTFTFNGVASINSTLGVGDDTLELTGTEASPLVLTGFLTSNNSWGNNKLDLNWVQVNGATNSLKVAGTFSTSEFVAADCIFQGPVTVNNVGAGGGGDTKTWFQRCDLQNVLGLVCGAGFDDFNFQDSEADIATGLGTTLTFGGGGARVLCTAINSHPGNTFHGPVVVNFGPNPAGVPALPQLDAFFSANRTDFRGALTVNNLGGDLRLDLSDNTTVGSNVATGGPLTLNSGPGVEKVDMDNAEAIWGAVFNLGVPGQNFGSTSTFDNNTRIGNHPGGVTVGLTFNCDDWGDNISITDCDVFGPANFLLNNGNNLVTLERNSPIQGLTMMTGTGTDGLSIKGTPTAPQVVLVAAVTLGNNSDWLYAQDVIFNGPGVLDGDLVVNLALNDVLTLIGVQWLGGPVNLLNWDSYLP